MIYVAWTSVLGLNVGLARVFRMGLLAGSPRLAGPSLGPHSPTLCPLPPVGLGSVWGANTRLAVDHNSALILGVFLAIALWALLTLLVWIFWRMWM